MVRQITKDILANILQDVNCLLYSFWLSSNMDLLIVAILAPKWHKTLIWIALSCNEQRFWLPVFSTNTQSYEAFGIAVIIIGY
jgi:hypothetical protein